MTSKDPLYAQAVEVLGNRKAASVNFSDAVT